MNPVYCLKFDCSELFSILSDLQKQRKYHSRMKLGEGKGGASIFENSPILFYIFLICRFYTYFHLARQRNFVFLILGAMNHIISLRPGIIDAHGLQKAETEF